MTVKNDPVRHEVNPFLKDMVVPVKGKKVQISTMGSDDNVLVNQATGEVHGTHLTTYKKVDSDQFVKLFTANIALTFDLKAAGIKAFNVLVWAVQHKAISKDEVDLESYVLKDFLKAHQDRKPPVKLSPATLKRGLRELENAQVIARALKPGRFFINPNFVFNGDRIAFTTLIERKEDGESDEEQLDLLD